MMNMQGTLSIVRPIGLINVSTDCFFNSVIQALFSLRSFRNHVQNFNGHVHYDNNTEINAVNCIQQLFRDMENETMNPLSSHEYLMELGLPDYVEHRQCDAQECMSYIIDLFYPRIDDKTNPKHNFVPDNSEFLIEGEEFVLCSNCNKQFIKKFGESLSQIEFLEPDVQHSVQLKVDDLTNRFGDKMDELYKCEHCKYSHPDGTLATQGRTVMNLKKYLIIQLKTFGYDQCFRQSFKSIPNLQIEEQVENILLGKLNLCAVIYHIGGDSPVSGHYVSSVKRNNIWYTCNDVAIKEDRVKLSCLTTEKNTMIPYLLIYEKDDQSNSLTAISTYSQLDNQTQIPVENNHYNIVNVEKDVSIKRKLQATSPDNADTVKLQKLSKQSQNSTACKLYVICPDENCDKHIVVNSMMKKSVSVPFRQV